MIVTLPLPGQITRYFPQEMVSFLQWFAFWSFSGLLIIPWLICVYQLVTHSVGRTKRIKHVLDEDSAPKVVIVMPCYQEDPDILLRTVDSLADCEYPPSCLHIFLSFDGDQEDELYLKTIEQLGVPLTLDTYPKSIDVTYRSTRVTISRFPHGGKRHCQKRTFKLIDKVYAEYLRRNDNLFMLFIDSDCILDKVCIQNFMYEMELKPGSKRNMLAMTGVITSTTEKNSLITVLQDMEYIHGQLFERSVESGCGAVTCLPGALTVLRFSAFRAMAKYYFADKAEQCDDLFDYGKCHLGEDRWLTHLFMIGAKEKYQIQMNTGAFCKTEAVQTYQSLLKQRRRWFLGFITNEVCMLTDVRLWRRYPILCLVRFAQNTIRTTALLFFIMVISIITTSQKIANLPVGFIAVSLGLNWILMLYFGAKLGRYKIMMYPLMFVINPFFNWAYMVYGIFTAGQRTWGGPRADAGAANSTTTPQAAIEHAEATGDDLNIVPETFKPAVEAITRKKSVKNRNVLPDQSLEGRFAAPELMPGGWYRQAPDSTNTLPDISNHPAMRRMSWESMVTATSGNNSVYLPRRVESIMGPEDQNLYHSAQARQRPAGGLHYEQEEYETSRPNTSTTLKGGYSISVRSASDDESSYGHGRMHSENSDMSVAQGKAVAGTEKVLAMPERTRQAPDHGSNRVRTGKSPLARRSFVRSASDSLEMAAVQGGQAMEMREQGAGLMDPRARSISPQGPQAPSVRAPASAAASTQGSQPPPTEPKSRKERKKLSKNARPGSSGSER
jgi:chitin synthase